MKEIKMSSEGLKKLQDELEYLKTTGRTEIAEKISDARSHGDLSENAEYDEAMNDQSKMEGRISELENMIKHAVIQEESDLPSDRVHVGSKVRIEANGKEYTYTISGATEADPFNGRISDESPVGKAIMGLQVGEKGEAILPNGTSVIYTVLEISK